MKEFTSVDRSDLQRAFVVAHRASGNPEISWSSRSLFREIAMLIWKAHGEQRPFPTEEELDQAIAQGAGTPGQHETTEGEQ